MMDHVSPMEQDTENRYILCFFYSLSEAFQMIQKIEPFSQAE